MSFLAVLLALVAAAAYGSGDFLGGIATRFAAATRVLLVSQAIGLVIVGVAAALVVTAPARPVDLGIGALAGLGGALGLVSLYRGLARGPMSIVAPLSGGIAAIVPVVVGLVIGERPGLLVGVGIALVIGAVALLGARESPADRVPAGGLGPSILLAISAGLGFGAFASILKFAGSDAGLWPLVGERITSVTIFVVIVAISIARSGRTGRTHRIDRTERTERRWWPIAVWAGIFEVAGNVAYLLGLREGLVSVVGPLSNLYPATTIILAAVLLRERVDRIQAIGLVGALTGAVLVSLG